MKTTITISIDVDVDYYENKSGISEKDLAERVYELVAYERDTLAAEVRITALKLLAGEDPS